MANTYCIACCYAQCNELYHHGIQGMKWGVMGKKLDEVIQQNLREEIGNIKKAEDVARAASYGY